VPKPGSDQEREILTDASGNPVTVDENGHTVPLRVDENGEILKGKDGQPLIAGELTAEEEEEAEEVKRQLLLLNSPRTQCSLSSLEDPHQSIRMPKLEQT